MKFWKTEKVSVTPGIEAQVGKARIRISHGFVSTQAHPGDSHVFAESEWADFVEAVNAADAARKGLNSEEI